MCSSQIMWMSNLCVNDFSVNQCRWDIKNEYIKRKLFNVTKCCRFVKMQSLFQGWWLQELLWFDSWGIPASNMGTVLKCGLCDMSQNAQSKELGKRP